MTKALIVGSEQVVLNLKNRGIQAITRVREAVEVTTMQVVIAAQANHDGDAHAMSRYKNVSSLLTNSMRPDIIKADTQSVIGQASANREYAADVELGTPRNKAYPYMYPALVTEGAKLAQNIQISMSKLT